ncbi:MAG: murein biosynthesis integral membrane protein MurJ [bacterium]
MLQPGSTGSKQPKSMGRHFRVVSLSTGLSRITGFARDMINAQLFGAGMLSDAYFSANRIPNLLRDLFAEGALSAALVPTLSKSLQKENAEQTWELLSEVFTFLLLSLGLVVALGIVLAPWLVRLIAPGFLSDPVKFTLTVHLTQILFPVLLFVSMAAFCMGILNSHQKYAVSALAPIAMNLTLIAAGLWMIYAPDTAPGSGLRNIYRWTLAASLGMALQWIVQVPSVWKLGGKIRLKWTFQHEGLFEILALMVPAIFSLSVTQIDLVLNQIFASFLPTGSVTCLNYGNRLMQLPYGVFGVSIATVVYPVISRQAAQADQTAFRATLSRALEACFFISIPCTVGLWLVSLPVCRLAFEHGEFLPASSLLVAEATCMYISGMFAQTGIKILTQSFYPIKKAKWPFWAALVNMITTAGLNLSAFLFISDTHTKFLMFPLATSFGALMNFIILLAGLERYNVHLDYKGMGKELVKILSSAAVMALVTWLALKSLQGFSFPGLKVISVFYPVAAGAAAYWGMVHWTQCASLHWIKNRGSK